MNPSHTRKSGPVLLELLKRGWADEDPETGRIKPNCDEGIRYLREHADHKASIDEVIEWSKTNRHGEHEPYAPTPSEGGCMRWGLCDMSWKGDAKPPQLGLFGES